MKLSFLAGRAGLLLMMAAPAIGAQTMLPNGGFEWGDAAPAEWRLSGGSRGQWVSGGARSGLRCLSIQGGGQDSGYWRTEALPLQAGGVYRFSFWGRRETNTTGGCVISGPAGVNRDFHLRPDWQLYQFIFTPPAHATNDFIRLGQWEQKGVAYFDDASLTLLQPVHLRLPGGWLLGEGESVEHGVYHCRINFGGLNANYSRALQENRCGYNSDRWTFGPGSRVTYRHDAPGGFASARLALNVNYHVAGAVRVEISGDGAQWQPLGVLDGARRSAELELAQPPAGDTLYVRLTGEGANCNLQVNRYDLAAPLRRAAADVQGLTLFMEVHQPAPPALGVSFTGVEPATPTRPAALLMRLHNRGPERLRLSATVAVDGAASDVLPVPPLAPGSEADLVLPWRPARLGENTLSLTLADATRRKLFAGTAEFRAGVLNDPRPGYWLAETPGAGLWWCESGWKIGRERPMPGRPAGGRPQPVKVAAARGEYEAVQLVLQPRANGELRAVHVSSLVDRRGRLLPARLEWLEVAYVRVTRPTDPTCEPGWYPDPLPPLQLPLPLQAGQNQPLWLSLRVERGAPAGEYRGEVTMQTSAGPVTAPLSVTVYDFDLPPQSHLRSAFGLSTGSINRYHNLTNAEQRRLVYEKYLDHFAEHRIAPYSFFEYSPINVRFVGEGAGKRAQVDLAAFAEAARRWLDERHFNSFLLPLRGMGGGTYHSRNLGELEGFKEGTPEHARLFKDYLGQVEQFLRERGWLDKAYTYWFDEPDPKDYEFVVDGMKRIKAAAPGLRRMLTEQPEPELLGHVDIWCGLTPEWTPETVAARRAAGEEVWWYICCAPHAPYLTEFIDHPGLELRLWPWQSWQYGVQGILVWETTYWTSSAAFPGSRRQNPWEDPMSYVSGYDFQAGHIGYWGNGDGRFLYPPRAALNSREPCLEGPVTSLRWENLRDGMEDYEYFRLLQQRVAELKRRGGRAALLRQAEALLQVPPQISQDTRNFTTDPRVLLAHRERLARMLESLGRP